MQDRLEKLFKEIGVEESTINYFNNANIEKVVLYDNDKMIEFIINTEKLIPIDAYYSVLDSLSNYFNTYEIIKLIIIPK